MFSKFDIREEQFRDYTEFDYFSKVTGQHFKAVVSKDGISAWKGEVFVLCRDDGDKPGTPKFSIVSGMGRMKTERVTLSGFKQLIKIHESNAAKPSTVARKARRAAVFGNGGREDGE